MSKLKDSIKQLIEDLSTIEVAVFTEEEQREDSQVLTYGRIEVEGDSVHYMDHEQCDEEISSIHNQTLKNAIRARVALWKMANKIL